VFYLLALQQNLWVTRGSPIALKAAKAKREKSFGLSTTDVMDDCTELTGTIIGAAMEVHNYWGPGLIESIYEKSLQHELTLRNVEVRRQVKL